MTPTLPKISACIIAYKEAAIIEDLIDNIASFVDEIVLVHDGPEIDETIPLAEKKALAYNLPFQSICADRKGHCEGHRALSFTMATHDWVLKIDCDERFDGDTTALKQYLVHHPDVTRVRLLWGDKKELASSSFSRRKAILFRKDKNSYVWVRAKKPLLQSGKSVDLDMVKILHLEVRRSFATLLKKAKKWSKKHAEAMFIPIDEVEKYNVTKEEEEDYERWRMKRITTAQWRIIPAAFMAMVLKLRGGKSLKAIIQGGVHTGLYYWYIFKLRHNRMK